MFISPKLIHVEDCIAWAAQHGYCFAQQAANEYGKHAGRHMHEDDNTAMYGTRSWSDDGWRLTADCRFTSAAPVTHDALTDKRRDDVRSDDRE